jgi:hypothetical protein
MSLPSSGAAEGFVTPALKQEKHYLFHRIAGRVVTTPTVAYSEALLTVEP